MNLTIQVERRAISVFRYPSTVGKDEKVDVVNPVPPARPSAKVDPETAAASAVVKEDESNQLRDELNKLRVIDADQRAAIEECDMIGDFGSKVSDLCGRNSILCRSISWSSTCTILQHISPMVSGLLMRRFSLTGHSSEARCLLELARFPQE